MLSTVKYMDKEYYGQSNFTPFALLIITAIIIIAYTLT